MSFRLMSEFFYVSGGKHMEKGKFFGGILAELPTPFEEDGTVDWFGFGRVLESCLSVGCSGCLLCGRTAEAETLSEKERRGLVEDAVLAAGKKAEVILCINPEKGNRAVEEACLGADAGAAALLLEARGKTSAAGILRTVRCIRKECPLPVVIERGSGEKRAEVYAEFAGENDICAIADRCGDFWGQLSLRDALDQREKTLPIFCEEQFALLPAMRYAGALSRLICCHPHAASVLWKDRGNVKGWEAHQRARALMKLFRGENGVEVLKWAMHRQGICAPTVRLPLCEPEQPVKNAIERALEKL